MRKLALAAIVWLALSSFAAPALAKNKDNRNALLRGTCEVTRFRSCIQNAPGFDANSQLQLLGNAHARTDAARATFTYNGDGTGTMNARLLNMRVSQPNLQAGEKPISQNEVTCNVTYSVNVDRTFSQQLVCDSITIAGRGAGGSSSVAGIQFQGQILLGGKFLILSDTEPNVETITDNDAGNTFQRICARSGYGVRSGGRGHGHDD